MEDQKILKISTRKNYLFALPFRVELKPHKLRLFDIYIFVVSVNQEYKIPMWSFATSLFWRCLSATIYLKFPGIMWISEFSLQFSVFSQLCWARDQIKTNFFCIDIPSLAQ